MKKQSLVEKALPLEFTIADRNDPIYSSGVVILSTVELEKLEKTAKSKSPKRGQNG